jgi:hypothetical protein
MQYISIILEHVDFLNTSNGGNVQFLECGLEFSVVSLGGCLGLLDNFTSGSSFSACPSNPSAARSDCLRETVVELREVISRQEGYI